MMKADKYIPELRFPEFDGEWDNMLLGDILTFKNGINAAKEDYGFGHKFINVLDIINNDFITNEKIIGSVNISDADFQKNLVEYGDILFQRSSETREEVGQANVYLDKNKPATFGGFVIRGKKKAEYNPLFLNYLLKTQKARNEITTKSGGSTRYNIGQETLSAVGVFMSNLNEQQKIASFLSSIDQRIQLLTHKKEQLEQYKKGIMQQIFSQELRFRDENGQEYPMWTNVKLFSILNEHLKKNSHNKIAEVFSVSKDKGVVNQIEHLGRSYAAENITHYKIVEPFDIIYTKSPTSNFPFGIIKQNITNRTGVVSPLYAVFKPITRALGTILHYHFLSWVNTYNYLVPLVQKGPKNTMNINNTDFLNGNSFVLPTSLAEQQKIASFLSSLDDKITQVNTQLDLTRKWKQGLLQQMFV